jgi:uncharacterized protein (TIGR03435 family)
MQQRPDGFEWRGVRLYALIQGAYELQSENEVVGLPDWTKSELYDITAKADADTAERWKKLRGKERWAEDHLMMRSILTDRCNFKGRQETRELPVYDLIIAKGGLKMKDAAPGETGREMIGSGKASRAAVNDLALVRC